MGGGGGSCKIRLVRVGGTMRESGKCDWKIINLEWHVEFMMGAPTLSIIAMCIKGWRQNAVTLNPT